MFHNSIQILLLNIFSAVKRCIPSLPHSKAVQIASLPYISLWTAAALHSGVDCFVGSVTSISLVIVLMHRINICFCIK